MTKLPIAGPSLSELSAEENERKNGYQRGYAAGLASKRKMRPVLSVTEAFRRGLALGKQREHSRRTKELRAVLRLMQRGVRKVERELQ